MAKASLIDKPLRVLQRKGVQRGVMGGSRGWFWVAVATWGLRRLRKAVSREPQLVYRGELRPGEAFVVDHRTETYGGKRVRAQRRR